MASATLQKIYNLPPGEFLRSASGFFCRLPDGRVAFIPSMFRLPWHPENARILDHQDIVKLLRAETIELVSSVSLLFVGIHYFFSDILTYYTTVLSLPLALVVHAITTFLAVAAIFVLNNASVSCFRIAMVRERPKAQGTAVSDALRRWSGRQRVWLLSFLSGERAANLNKLAVMLYLLMFLCSGPLLLIVLLLLAGSGKAQSLDGMVAFMLALYIAISVWAMVESTMVLHQRLRAGRERREARHHASAQGL